MEMLIIALLKFPIACLAIWRIASLITGEEGPWGIFRRIRAYVTLSSPSLGEGIHCLWCISLWISPFLAFWITTDIPTWVIATFALSAGSIMIDAFVTYLYGNELTDGES
jgi:hypothetical protein